MSIILDLRKIEGSILREVGLRDEESGEALPQDVVMALINLAKPKSRDDPHRYQVVKYGGGFLLFPMNGKGKVLQHPDNLSSLVEAAERATEAFQNIAVTFQKYGNSTITISGSVATILSSSLSNSNKDGSIYIVGSSPYGSFYWNDPVKLTNIKGVK